MHTQRLDNCNVTNTSNSSNGNGNGLPLCSKAKLCEYYQEVHTLKRIERSICVTLIIYAIV